MKKMVKKASCLIVVLITLFSLFGCRISDKKEPTGSLDIYITDEESYSNETIEYAKRVIFDLLTHYSQKSGVDKEIKLFLSELRRTQISEKIQKATITGTISEDKYLTFISILENRGKGVIDSLVDGVEDNENLTAFYTELINAVGINYVGKTLYNSVLCLYDFFYDKFMYEYEKYGDKYGYLKADAEKVIEEKNTFIEHIGEERFTNLIKSAVLIPNLVLGGVDELGKMENFTDEEIIAFLSYIDFSSLEMTDKAWNIVFSLFLQGNENGSYIEKIIYNAKDKDIDNIVTIMNECVYILAFIQRNIDNKDVELLREGKSEEVLSRAFEKFGDEEWSRFEKIGSVDLSFEEYEKIAESEFGSGFTQYKDQVTIYTVDQVKEAAGKDNFYEVLKGYIAGISPAFSYGMNK